MAAIQKEKNISICILRVLFCYEVILCHFGGNNITFPFEDLKLFAVPTFMLMSFALSSSVFLEKNRSKLWTRCKRILTPQVFWSVVYYVVFWLIGTLLYIATPSFTDFLWQLFTGHSGVLNSTMWYQIVLLVLTVFAGILFCFTKNLSAPLLALNLAAAAAFLLEYSGANITWLENLPPDVKFPLGRLVEMIPYAAAGIDYSALKAAFKGKSRLVSFSLGAALLLITGILHVANPLCPGYGYQGLLRFSGTILLFAVADNLPLHHLPAGIRRACLFLSQYTLGIYCMHRLTAFFLETGVRVLFDIDWNQGMAFSAAVYVISFAASWVLNKIPVAFVRQSVA